MATGKFEHAKKAVLEFLDMQAGIAKPRHLLDSGSYRWAFRFGRYVYKVERFPDDDTNRKEYEAITAGREQGIPFMPPVDLWLVPNEDGSEEYPVICMPFYKRAAHTVMNYWEAQQQLKLVPEDYRWDVGGGNLRVTDGGRLRITDCQGPGLMK